MNLTEKLRKVRATGKLTRFSIVGTSKGYQANLETTPSSFRVRIKKDPLEAAIDVLGSVAEPTPRSFESLLK
ncbi:hypothetical protein [Roseibium sediminis]|uniref:hypothetical protein n=1 Tax=Roseibium sediminis TaxID=1775174 RepID=UPI00123D4AA5|nr:hypothetical protein [Roseibium sediminis]